MCRNKVRYPNDPAAQAALALINPGKSKAGKPNRSYKCPKCSGFHLTRSPRR